MHINERTICSSVFLIMYSSKKGNKVELATFWTGVKMLSSDITHWKICLNTSLMTSMGLCSNIWNVVFHWLDFLHVHERMFIHFKRLSPLIINLQLKVINCSNNKTCCDMKIIKPPLIFYYCSKQFDFCFLTQFDPCNLYSSTSTLFCY